MNPNNYGFLPPETYPNSNNNNASNQMPGFSTQMPQQHVNPNAPPPAYTPVQPILSREEIFRNIMMKYEISVEYSNLLQKLRDFKIVFIFDDSGSMSSTLNESPLNEINKNSMLKATRWDELQYFANISIEIANFFNNESSQGTDVYFLNKPPVKNVTNVDQFMYHLKQLKPNGYTPLNKIFNLALNENMNAIKERKLLIIILTDGEPSDDYGRTDIKSFKNSLLARNPMNKIFVNIITCTDDEESVAYLNRWDVQIPHLDVIDDYNSERKEVRRKNGSKYRFSYGDYVVKSMVGSVDPKLDRSDERHKCAIL